MNLIVNQINYGLIKEENFTINVCKNNDILIYSTHDEGKLVIAERFIKTLKAKIYDRKCYLSYLNKLLDQYSNTYHHSINKNHINAGYSTLTEKIETNPKAPMFKVNDRVRITKIKIFLVKLH